MRGPITHDRMVDGGYPFDSDLHQGTDDGCPLVPDPARWVDVDWRDNLGESDTFEGPALPTAHVWEPSPPTGTMQLRFLRCCTCGRTEARSPDELLLLYAPVGWPECCGRRMDYSARSSPADAVPTHSAAA